MCKKQERQEQSEKEEKSGRELQRGCWPRPCWRGWAVWPAAGKAEMIGMETAVKGPAEKMRKKETGI